MILTYVSMHVQMCGRATFELEYLVMLLLHFSYLQKFIR